MVAGRQAPRNDPSGTGSNLYTIRPDGSSLHRLTHYPPSAHVLEGSWSPDGRQIIIATTVGGSTDLFVMKADGTGITQVTHDANWEDDADWGPAPR